jgi:hypothetical protein
MLQHNSYFDGAVQSIGFQRNGRRFTAGVIAIGEFHFDTQAAERMSVVSGELFVKGTGATEWRLYAAGTYFEIPANSGFQVRAEAPAAYVCEFL